MRVSVSISSKSQCQFCDFLIQFQILYSNITSSYSITIKETLYGNFQPSFRSFNAIFNEKRGVPNAPFLILIFYKFLGYESKMIKSTVIKFSKKLLNYVMNRLKKSYGPGLSHFYATTIWNSVPVLMTTPVVHMSTRGR